MRSLLQEPLGFWKLGSGRNRQCPHEPSAGSSGRRGRKYAELRLDLAVSSSGVVPLRCPGRGVGLPLRLGCCLRYTGPAGPSRAEPSGSGSTRPGHERGRMMYRRPRRCCRRPRGAAALGDPARASGECSAYGGRDRDPRLFPAASSPQSPWGSPAFSADPTESDPVCTRSLSPDLGCDTPLRSPVFSVANIRVVIKCCHPSVSCEVFVGMLRRTSVFSNLIPPLFNEALILCRSPPTLPPAPVHDVKGVVTRKGQAG